MKFKPIADLKKCRVLLSNDDGIDAYGIKLLEEILTPYVGEIWVVAPKTQKSGAGHAITPDKLHGMVGHGTIDDFPNEILKVSDKHYAIDGTPSDCVRIALSMIMPQQRPNLIISGINMGRNIADDITYSGTIGAAIEGLMFGIPSIAVSQHMDKATIIHWENTKKYLLELLEKITKGNYSADTFININFPNVAPSELKGIAVCQHKNRRYIKGTHYNNRIDYEMIKGKECKNKLPYPDDSLSIDGYITVSALKINLTDKEGLKELTRILMD